MPVHFYLGYFAVLGWENIVIRQLAKDLAALNAGVAVEYDPSRQALVGTPQQANLLTMHFGVPVAHVADPSEETGYESYRLIEMSVCDRARQDSERMVEASIGTSHVFSRIGPGGERDQEVCQVRMADAPDLPILRIDVAKNTTHRRWLEIQEVTVSFTGPDGPIAATRMAEIARLPVLPLPMAGCVLNSSPVAWECSAGFLRIKTVNLPEPDSNIRRTYLEVARALGLSKVPQGERIASDPMPVLERLGAASANEN